MGPERRRTPLAAILIPLLAQPEASGGGTGENAVVPVLAVPGHSPGGGRDDGAQPAGPRRCWSGPTSSVKPTWGFIVIGIFACNPAGPGGARVLQRSTTESITPGAFPDRRSGWRARAPGRGRRRHAGLKDLAPADAGAGRRVHGVTAGLAGAMPGAEPGFRGGEFHEAASARGSSRRGLLWRLHGLVLAAGLQLGLFRPDVTRRRGRGSGGARAPPASVAGDHRAIWKLALMTAALALGMVAAYEALSVPAHPGAMTSASAASSRGPMAMAGATTNP